MPESLCLMECLSVFSKLIKAHFSPWGQLGTAPLTSEQLNLLISPKQADDGKTALWEYVLGCTGPWDVPGNGGITQGEIKSQQ